MNKTYNHKTFIRKNIENYIDTLQDKPMLKFITCGSVDDGKSTLIGRLLHDSQAIIDDELEQLITESKRIGTQGTNIDFALLVDGLIAEREQGITIDVAYRYFHTKKRKFIVIDTPGHTQYTRNMVTGASNADLSILLIDARKGVLNQTRHHAYLCHLLGIKNFVLAINKMDLVDYDKNIFGQIVQDFKLFAKNIGVYDFTSFPISALHGDNIVQTSKKTPWYKGNSLLNHIEKIEIKQFLNQEKSFLMPVQWVNRPNPNFRGLSGKVISGSIKPNEKVYIYPSGKTTFIDRIVNIDDDLKYALAGQSITITLKGELDCSRGHIITNSKNSVEIADQFETTIIWMHETSLIPGRSYYIKIGTQTISAYIWTPKHLINLNSFEKFDANTLDLNSIGVVNVTTDRPIPFTLYKENRNLGSFIIIDKITNSTIGAGLINSSINNSKNIYPQTIDVSSDHHARIKNQIPAILWMTGLSGAGKSTIANAIEKKLAMLPRHTVLLDGDNIRYGLNKDLGFTDADRVENIRRVAEVAKLMANAGLIVIASFISPFRLERQLARQINKPFKFYEIFIDTPLEIVEKNDVKGLYAKARSGKLKNFTGIDSPYEIPENPDIRIDTTRMSIDQAAEVIISKLLI